MTPRDHDLTTTGASHREPRKALGRLTSRMLVVIATAAGLALLATGCGVSPDVPTPAAESARVDQAMTYIRQHNQDIAAETGNQGESRPPMPYLLVGVRDSNGYRGYVSSEPGAQPKSGGVVNVGSSTKSFTAALILQLDQEGKLSLDDTLADPRWNGVLQWPNGQNITLRMVLAHTAGIPDYEDSEPFAMNRLDPNWDPTPQQVIAFPRVLPPYFTPGTSWHYSNTDYQILGLVIEAVTGDSYGDELASRFFRPLGLTHTYLYGYQQGPEPEPSYFVWCEGVTPPSLSSSADEKLAAEAACVGKPPLYLPMTDYYGNSEHKLAWSDGGIASTAEDMTLWITKLIGSDEVLDAAHRTLMQQASPQSIAALAKNTQSPPAVREYGVGYGLGLNIFHYSAGMAYGHGGNIEGFSGNCVYLPGSGVAIGVIAPMITADSAFDSSNRIATAVAGPR